MIVLAFLVGAGFGCGVWLLSMALGGRAKSEEVPNRTRSVTPVEAVTAGVAGWLAYFLTGWPIAGLFGGLLGLNGRKLFAGRRDAEAIISRTEAIASWTEMLRDTLAASSGLHRTIVAIARVAPAPILPEVRALADRIEAREGLPSALRGYAEDLANATGDLVVSALIVAYERRASNLTEVLGALAKSAREEAGMQRRIYTARARNRAAASVITVTVLATITALAVFNRSFLNPYDSPGGQAMLAAIGALFGGALWGLARLARLPEMARVLSTPNASVIQPGG